METVNTLMSVEYSVLDLNGWKLSLVELLGILTGLLSVFYATRRHILTWVLGLANTFFFALIFYQVQLYSDMWLQLFFAIATLYGLAKWRTGTNADVQPREMSHEGRWGSVLAVVLVTLVLGMTMSSIHELLPGYFPKPAAYPYTDAFTAALSIVATVLLAQRAIESWLFWIVVDVVCVGLYFARGIPFMALLYGVFLVLATSGFISWRRALQHA